MFSGCGQTIPPLAAASSHSLITGNARQLLVGRYDEMIAVVDAGAGSGNGLDLLENVLVGILAEHVGDHGGDPTDRGGGGFLVGVLRRAGT